MEAIDEQLGAIDNVLRVLNGNSVNRMGNEIMLDAKDFITSE
jgi:hypothetical protein